MCAHPWEPKGQEQEFPAAGMQILLLLATLHSRLGHTRIKTVFQENLCWRGGTKAGVSPEHVIVKNIRNLFTPLGGGLLNILNIQLQLLLIRTSCSECLKHWRNPWLRQPWEPPAVRGGRGVFLRLSCVSLQDPVLPKEPPERQGHAPGAGGRLPHVERGVPVQLQGGPAAPPQ